MPKAILHEPLWGQDGYKSQRLDQLLMIPSNVTFEMGEILFTYLMKFLENWTSSSHTGASTSQLEHRHSSVTFLIEGATSTLHLTKYKSCAIYKNVRKEY